MLRRRWARPSQCRSNLCTSLISCCLSEQAVRSKVTKTVTAVREATVREQLKKRIVQLSMTAQPHVPHLDYGTGNEWREGLTLRAPLSGTLLKEGCRKPVLGVWPGLCVDSLLKGLFVATSTASGEPPDMAAGESWRWLKWSRRVCPSGDAGP